MNVDRITLARARMKRTKLVRRQTKPGRLYAEAIRVFDYNGKTRARNVESFVQSYVALHA
jgi:hypothetical protein